MAMRLGAAVLLAAWMAVSGGCGGEPTGSARVPGLPGDSLYHLAAVWRDQDGRSLQLRELQGDVQVVAMIFTHCPMACPAIVANLKAIERALPLRLRPDTRFLLVSMDHLRDLPPVLQHFARQKELDLQRWRLLHGSADAVRELAAAIGFRYAQVDGGDFSHSNLIVVLDRFGRPVFRLEGLDVQPGPAVQAIGLAAADG